MAEPPHIDPENTWVTADSHWGHDNIVGFCERPADHHEIMIRQWVSEVPSGATVLHLGDLSYRNNAYFKHVISPQLTGARKLLILGNHDRQRHSYYRDCGFKIVKPFDIRYHSRVVSFDHYPLAVAPRHTWARTHIHGHIHNNGYGGKDTPYTPFAAGQINVSVEQTHYRPVNLARLLDGHIDGCYPPERKP